MAEACPSPRSYKARPLLSVINFFILRLIFIHGAESAREQKGPQVRVAGLRRGRHQQQQRSRLLFLFTFFCVFLRYKNITTLVGCVPDPERTGVGRRCCLECKSQPENGPPTPPSPTRLPLCMLIGRSEAASKAFAERKQANGWLGRRTTPTAVARPYQSQESLLFLLLSQERI